MRQDFLKSFSIEMTCETDEVAHELRVVLELVVLEADEAKGEPQADVL